MYQLAFDIERGRGREGADVGRNRKAKAGRVCPKDFSFAELNLGGFEL
jgi:hypothetical protein